MLFLSRVVQNVKAKLKARLFGGNNSWNDSCPTMQCKAIVSFQSKRTGRLKTIKTYISFLKVFAYLAVHGIMTLLTNQVTLQNGTQSL